jgi:hypothetical protein
MKYILIPNVFTYVYVPIVVLYGDCTTAPSELCGRTEAFCLLAYMTLCGPLNVNRRFGSWLSTDSTALCRRR